MPPRRRVPPDEGLRAVRAVRDGATDRASLARAVRFTLEELAARHPGATCEVRVPPFAVIQCLAGPRHTRGTPPNVVETDPATWLALATGTLSWARAVEDGALRPSGERSDLSAYLPLLDST